MSAIGVISATIMANTLKREYGKKTAEVEGTVGNLRSNLDKTAGDFRESAASFRQDAVKRFGQAHDQMDQSIDDSRKAVADHPFAAVGIALGIGIIAGALVRRRSNA